MYICFFYIICIYKKRNHDNQTRIKYVQIMQTLVSVEIEPFCISAPATYPPHGGEKENKIKIYLKPYGK